VAFIRGGGQLACEYNMHVQNMEQLHAHDRY